MTLKSLMPVFAAGLLCFGACAPEKQTDNEESTESKSEMLAEQKLALGKRVYDANCAGCHDAGVAGAPKPGDNAAWKERMTQGFEVIVNKSIQGFDGTTGAMPPKGGNAVLTDEEVSNAVAFMVSDPNTRHHIK
ncbi:MAG: c-type cytochrome [Chlorobiaceae bacterium]